MLINLLISARVLGWARRKAISQTTLWPSSPQAQASREKHQQQSHFQPKINLVPTLSGDSIFAQDEAI